MDHCLWLGSAFGAILGMLHGSTLPTAGSARFGQRYDRWQSHRTLLWSLGLRSLDFSWGLGPCPLGPWFDRLPGCSIGPKAAHGAIDHGRLVSDTELGVGHQQVDLRSVQHVGIIGAGIADSPPRRPFRLKGSTAPSSNAPNGWAGSGRTVIRTLVSRSKKSSTNSRTGRCPRALQISRRVPSSKNTWRTMPINSRSARTFASGHR